MRYLAFMGALLALLATANAESETAYRAYRSFLQRNQPPPQVRRWWDERVRDLPPAGFVFDLDKNMLSIADGPLTLRLWAENVGKDNAFVLDTDDGKWVAVPLARYGLPNRLLQVFSHADNTGFLDLDSGYGLVGIEAANLRNSFRMKLLVSRLVGAGVIEPRFESRLGRTLRQIKNIPKRFRPRR